MYNPVPYKNLFSTISTQLLPYLVGKFANKLMYNAIVSYKIHFKYVAPSCSCVTGQNE
jgi:hypothetical protein